MKQAYKDWRPSNDTRTLVSFVNELINTYLKQGLVLSVRQLYYQLVARGMIENTERSYKRVASILNDARLAGLIDWDAIEDRGRDIEVRNHWRSGSELIHICAQQFYMDMWKSQPYRVFVIVEKAALAGVLGGVCREWDVPLLAARGYPSVSVLRDLARQHIIPAVNAGQGVVILHLGDHDPSGIDMTRDLDERLSLFVRADTGLITTVSRIALTMEQISEKNPPPNPAKTTDSRFSDYRSRFGDESWELDALDPPYLISLVEGRIKERLDHHEWELRTEEINQVRARLSDAAAQFDDNDN